MKNRIYLFGIILTFASLVGAAPVDAATACIDWDCDSGTLTCTFDAGCSSAPFLWKYYWDFGDGTNSGLTGSSTIQHTYPLSLPYVTVTFSVLYFDDPGSTSVECDIVVYNAIAPPLPTDGRCSFTD